jgi:prepilin-type N-terminal cleavage/methylation domain-containing protein
MKTVQWKHQVRKINAFSFVELIISITILGIIAVIVIPSYLDYSKRKYYADIVNIADQYKAGVSNCFLKTKSLSGCDGGRNGVPVNRVKVNDKIASITTVNGVITVVPLPKKKVHRTDTYILTPTIVSGQLTWAASGGAVTNDLAE